MVIPSDTENALVPATAVTTEDNNITHSGLIRFDGDTRVISEFSTEVNSNTKNRNLTHIYSLIRQVGLGVLLETPLTDPRHPKVPAVAECRLSRLIFCHFTSLSSSLYPFQPPVSTAFSLHPDTRHPVASPAIGHWGSCPLDFQQFYF